MARNVLYDCIIIGAGPGGLQAGIYLGRFNRAVLLIDRTGGRTAHARSIENFLSHRDISGRELIELGLEQARSFHVEFEPDAVVRVAKQEHFIVETRQARHQAKYVIVSSGVRDNYPPIENLHAYLGAGFYTCVDCDGYKTTGKKLLVIGNAVSTVRLAFAMKELYTRDVTLNLIHYDPPGDYKEALRDEGIPLVKGTPVRIVGGGKIEAVELKNGDLINCEAIMSNFGYKLNDEFLQGLDLNRDANGFKFTVNHYYESSLSGLYVVGPLNTGNDQAVIAAGEGAVAAIEINKRLLNL